MRGSGTGRVQLDKYGGEFILRAYAPADRDGLETMYREFEPKRCAQGLPPHGEEQRVRWLDSILAGGDHVVVEVEGVVKGHGMLLPFGPDAAELANFLHQSIRDRGIGTSLNRALLELGRDRGMRRVWLSVEPSNRRAIRSYEKVGFERVPTSTPWAPEVELEIHLRIDA